jgi:hypothetical protein
MTLLIGKLGKLFRPRNSLQRVMIKHVLETIWLVFDPEPIHCFDVMGDCIRSTLTPIHDDIIFIQMRHWPETVSKPPDEEFVLGFKSIMRDAFGSQI